MTAARPGVHELRTPALIADDALIDHNISVMADALPGPRLRPHVKAHKCTALARRQHAAGHHGFTCATVREAVGMADAGLGDDLLLANECLDLTPLRRVIDAGARLTVAVDSPETVSAAAHAGVREVVIDVQVGLPRCGCPPEEAGRIADLARGQGLEVRGVMGYEGHLMMLGPPAKKTALTERAMRLLLQARDLVGGGLVTAGGTGTYRSNTWADEIQAGSYVLMDSQYAKLGFPFRQAIWVLGTVISVSAGHAVADVGLKALGMDHGNPRIDGAEVLFVSDEHVTFVPQQRVRVGDRVRVTPAHLDPTVAMHEVIHVVSGEDVVETWPVDLRGW